MQVVLAESRGLCTGFHRAIEIMETALRECGSPIYVLREALRPVQMVDRLHAKGVRFIDSLSEVPAGGTVVFSAHGVPPQVEREAKARSLNIIDATCPLVSMIHADGARLTRTGGELVVIGQADHPETEATLGRLGRRAHQVGTIEDVARLDLATSPAIAYVVQTTLSVHDVWPVLSALRARFPTITDLTATNACTAVVYRQQAAWGLAGMVDLVLVVGDTNSPGCRSLRDIARQRGTPAEIVDSSLALDEGWLTGVNRLGITAGLSTHDDLVQELIERLRTEGPLELWTLPEPKERIGGLNDAPRAMFPPLAKDAIAGVGAW